MSRREYDISITVNGIKIKKVIIDPHYELKHAESINDETILKLVQTIDGEEFEEDDINPPFAYFAKDRIYLEGKFYKLVWLLEENQIYIGIVNAYRR